jgi:hypothetical protein
VNEREVTERAVNERVPSVPEVPIQTSLQTPIQTPNTKAYKIISSKKSGVSPVHKPIDSENRLLIGTGSGKKGPGAATKKR